MELGAGALDCAQEAVRRWVRSGLGWVLTGARLRATEGHVGLASERGGGERADLTGTINQLL